MTVKRTKNAEVKRLSVVRHDCAVSGGFARLRAASLNWGTQRRRHFEKPTHISYVEHNRFISELLALKLVSHNNFTLTFEYLLLVSHNHFTLTFEYLLPVPHNHFTLTFEYLLLGSHNHFTLTNVNLVLVRQLFYPDL